MIHLVQARTETLEAWFAEAFRIGGMTLWLHSTPGSHQSWDSLRRLLPQLEEQLGGSRLDSLLWENRTAASFLLPQLATRLSASEQLEKERLAAYSDSQLSHHWLIQRALVDRTAQLLSKLIIAAGSRVGITSPVHVDRLTLSVLKAVLRLGLAETAELTIGYDRYWSPGASDENGLFWRYPLSSAHYLLVGSSFSSTRQLHDSAAVAPEPPPIWSEHDCHEEQICLRLLYGTRSLPRASIKRSLGALRRAFAGYGFQGTLRLGLALLEHPSSLAPEEAAEVHGLVALAAHNEQFYSTVDSPLNDFLQHHLCQAMASERRSSHRTALLYRLAVTAGRRQKKFKEATAHADQAIEEAGDLSPTQAEYQEAWARNIRAYLRARLGDLRGATEDEQTAFSLLAKARERLPGATAAAQPVGRDWLTELTLSQAVVCSNLCTLCQYSRDEGAFRHWLGEEVALAALLPGMTRFLADTSTRTYRQVFRWDLAWEEAQRGLRSASEERDGYRQYTFLSDLADLSFRLGDAVAAVNAFDQAKLVAGPFVEDGQHRLDLARAIAATRAGGSYLADGRRVLETIVTELPESSVADRAEIAAALGWISAVEAESEAMERWFDKAISGAVADGGRDLLIRVALLAGSANRAIGRSEYARDAWTRGLEIAGFKPGETPDSAVASDILRCLIGLLDLNPTADDLMKAALLLVPAALDEGEVWWELPRWLSAILRSLAAGSTIYREPRVLETLGLLTVLADQRSDCRGIVARIRASLPNLPTPELPGEIAA